MLDLSGKNDSVSVDGRHRSRQGQPDEYEGRLQIDRRGSIQFRVDEVQLRSFVEDAIDAGVRPRNAPGPSAEVLGEMSDQLRQIKSRLMNSGLDDLIADLEDRNHEAGVAQEEVEELLHRVKDLLRQVDQTER